MPLLQRWALRGTSRTLGGLWRGVGLASWCPRGRRLKNRLGFVLVIPQQLPLARLLDDPATEDEAREQLAEPADLIGNYETWHEGRWMENLARVRELYARLFGR